MLGMTFVFSWRKRGDTVHNASSQSRWFSSRTTGLTLVQRATTQEFWLIGWRIAPSAPGVGILMDPEFLGNGCRDTHKDFKQCFMISSCPICAWLWRLAYLGPFWLAPVPKLAEIIFVKLTRAVFFFMINHLTVRISISRYMALSDRCPRFLCLRSNTQHIMGSGAPSINPKPVLVYRWVPWYTNAGIYIGTLWYWCDWTHPWVQLIFVTAMMLTRSQLEDWATSSWTLRPGSWLPAFSQNTQPHLNEERFEGWMSALHYSNSGFRNPLCLKMPFIHTIYSVYMTMIQKRDTKCQVNHNYLGSKIIVRGSIFLSQTIYHIHIYIYSRVGLSWVIQLPFRPGSYSWCRFHHIFLP